MIGFKKRERLFMFMYSEYVYLFRRVKEVKCVAKCQFFV